jgi:hypothetical protein
VPRDRPDRLKEAKRRLEEEHRAQNPRAQASGEATRHRAARQLRAAPRRSAASDRPELHRPDRLARIQAQQRSGLTTTVSVTALLGAELLPARSTATTVQVCVPATV